MSINFRINPYLFPLSDSLVSNLNVIIRKSSSHICNIINVIMKFITYRALTKKFSITCMLILVLTLTRKYDLRQIHSRLYFCRLKKVTKNISSFLKNFNLHLHICVSIFSWFERFCNQFAILSFCSSAVLKYMI